MPDGFAVRMERALHPGTYCDAGRARNRAYTYFPLRSEGLESDRRVRGRKFCCDQSPNRHASKHSIEPDIQSCAESDEDWAWCYVDELGVEPAPRVS